jgi:purine-binding chemotaxis protein CheW
MGAESKAGGVDKEGVSLLQLVSFFIGGEEYAVDILTVREIHRMLDITRMPDAPAYVEGVTNLRGQVIPIINLRKRFGMEAREGDPHTRVVVVELSGKVAGFVVDSVREVLRIPSSVTERPPEIGGVVRSEFITAVGKLQDRLLILLNLDDVLCVGGSAEVDPVCQKA